MTESYPVGRDIARGLIAGLNAQDADLEQQMAEASERMRASLGTVLDAHTAEIPDDYLGTACEECGVVVRFADLAAHLVERHGHEPD